MKNFRYIAALCFLIFTANIMADQVLVYDDFEDGVFDTSKWVVTGDTTTVTESGGILSVLRGTPYATYVQSLTTVSLGSLDTGTAITLTGTDVHYTNYAKGGAFGLNDTAGSFTNCILLWQDNAGTLTLYMAKNGVAQTKYLLGGNMFHGDWQFVTTADKVIIKNGNTIFFDSTDPVLDGGISWNIPTAAMSVFMRSSLYNLTYGGTYGAVELKVGIPDTITFDQPMQRAVFQRNDFNVASVPVSGMCGETPVFDAVQARYVLQSDPCVVGQWQNISFNGYLFDDTLSVPAGGWYDIEVRALSSGSQVQYGKAEKFGVGEVFITSGQSNSVSYGAPAMTPTEDRVSAWAWTGNWQLAADPQPTFGSGGVGGSPWSRLGDMLVQELNLPVAFITTGYGGSAVADWLPSANNHYYKLERAIDAAGSNGVRAVLWHQGETDGLRQTPMAVYAERLTTIINATRQYAGWQIPWGVAVVGWQYYEPQFDPAAVLAVNAGQRLVTDTVPGVFEGPYTDDLDLSYRHDWAHFNAAGLQIHAQRWKSAILRRINMGDFEPDGDVDFVDFAEFANKWLQIDCGSCDYADLNDDGNVDSLDLSDFADIWLSQF